MFKCLCKSAVCGCLFTLAGAGICSHVYAANSKATQTPPPVARSIVGQLSAGLPTPVNLQRKAIESIGAGQAGSVVLPGVGSVELVGQGTETLASGNVAWRGYVRQSGRQYAAALIFSPAGMVGDIGTDAGRYHLEISADYGQVATLFSASAPAVDKCASTTTAAGNVPAATALDAQLAAAAVRTDKARIDVMFVYTPGVESKYGNGLPAILDGLLLAANSATSQSGVGISFVLAGAMRVAPRKLVTGDLSAALIAVTSSEDPALPRNDDFVGVAAKRHAWGADLVVSLVTRADYTVGCASTACIVGTAWQATKATLSSSQPGLHAYAIADVSAGNLGLTVTHEIGHLLGAGHDYASGGEGLFADSRGFRSADGVHGDLMSYAQQPSLVFSGPAVSCDGSVCGAADDAPTPADNVRALNSSRFLVAAYQQSAAPAQADIAGQWWEGQSNGRQLQLARSGNTLTALLFTYTSAGQPAWYVAIGCQLQANKCSADLYMSWTYQFGLMTGAALDPAQVMAAKVGTIELDAGNAGVLSVVATVNAERAVILMTRQSATAGDASRNGVWWVSGGLESGVTVAQNGSSLTLVWFTYGVDGRSSWYMAPDCRFDTQMTSCSGDVYQSSSPTSVASVNGVSAIVTQRVGAVGLAFAGSYVATFSWQIGSGAGSATVEKEMNDL